MKLYTLPHLLPVKSKYTFLVRLLLHTTSLRAPASSLGHRPELFNSKQETCQLKRRQTGPAAQPCTGTGAPAWRSHPEELWGSRQLNLPVSSSANENCI